MNKFYVSKAIKLFVFTACAILTLQTQTRVEGQRPRTATALQNQLMENSKSLTGYAAEYSPSHDPTNTATNVVVNPKYGASALKTTLASSYRVPHRREVVDDTPQSPDGELETSDEVAEILQEDLEKQLEQIEESSVVVNPEIARREERSRDQHLHNLEKQHHAQQMTHHHEHQEHYGDLLHTAHQKAGELTAMLSELVQMKPLTQTTNSNNSSH